MDTKTARLANEFWLSISDQQIIALRATWSFREASNDQPGTASGGRSLLPELNWPATLFDDEISCH